MPTPLALVASTAAAAGPVPRASMDMPAWSVLSRFTEQPVVIALVIGLVILCLAIHELAHAYVALRCGDTTARDMGRLTWNPIPHIDPVMTILVPAVLILSGANFLFGGAKPVPVMKSNLRHPWRDMMLVAIAGPLSNLLLGLLFVVFWKAAVFGAGMDRYAVLPTGLGALVYFNWILAVFNMLPIPPLDGSRVVAYLLPSGEMRRAYSSLDRYGLFLVLGVFFFFRTQLSSVIFGAVRPMRDWADVITFGRWGL